MCFFVSVVVMCAVNEPTPRNIPYTCYLAEIKFRFISGSSSDTDHLMMYP